MYQLVLHFVLLVIAGSLIALVPLVLGKLVRPTNHTPEKDAIYECGEPTIGTSYVQFDLRFYTVALLFIIFDVEVAFFFPWATMYGNAIQLTDTALSEPARIAISEKLLNAPAGTLAADQAISAATAVNLGWLAFVDIAVFFAVLMVGFAYVWKRGDLEWVRASNTVAQREAASQVSAESPSSGLVTAGH